MKNYCPLLSGMCAMLLLASCATNDEPEETTASYDSNAVRFGAVIDRSSRAQDATTQNLTTFNVYAYTSNGTTFMDNVKVSKQAGSGVWTYSPTKYWPNLPVDFYAFAPASWVPATGPLGQIRYTNGYGLDDLIYATEMNRTAPTAQGDEAQVRFNFRHALARITVMMRTASPDITAKVSSVSLVGTHYIGDFKFPTSSTSTSFADKPDSTSIGTWSNLSGETHHLMFLAHTPQDCIEVGNSYVNADPNREFSQFQIPQPLTDASGKAIATDYIAIELILIDKTTGEQVWPNAATPEDEINQASNLKYGRVRFGLVTPEVKDWKAGYHYIYNVTINSPSSLGQIEFGQPTVDTFITVNTEI